jgi:hypothetical protein
MISDQARAQITFALDEIDRLTLVRNKGSTPRGTPFVVTDADHQSDGVLPVFGVADGRSSDADNSLAPPSRTLPSRRPHLTSSSSDASRSLSFRGSLAA